MLYKNYHGNLKQICGIHGRNSRNKLDLHTRYCSTLLYHTSVTNMSITLFNKLPAQIKNWTIINLLREK